MSKGSDGRVGLADNAHDVGFFHDQQVFAADFDFRAGPFAEQNAVAGFDVQRDSLPSSSRAPEPTETISPSAGLFLSGVRDDDAASSFGVSFDAANDNAVVQRAEFHGIPAP